jgi:hypothetical protein
MITPFKGRMHVIGGPYMRFGGDYVYKSRVSHLEPFFKIQKALEKSQSLWNVTKLIQR